MGLQSGQSREPPSVPRLTEASAWQSLAPHLRQALTNGLDGVAPPWVQFAGMNPVYKIRFGELVPLLFTTLYVAFWLIPYCTSTGVNQ